MSFVTKPNVISLWDDSLIDLNKIARIEKPELIAGGLGSMRESRMQVAIQMLGGNEIVIKEYFMSAYETHTGRAYSFYRDNAGGLRSDKPLWKPLWYCVDGKQRTIEDCYHDMTIIKVYADFKKKVDELIEVWKQGGVDVEELEPVKENQ